jgi:hypothetical protein
MSQKYRLIFFLINHSNLSPCASQPHIDLSWFMYGNNILSLGIRITYYIYLPTQHLCFHYQPHFGFFTYISLSLYCSIACFLLSSFPFSSSFSSFSITPNTHKKHSNSFLLCMDIMDPSCGQTQVGYTSLCIA